MALAQIVTTSSAKETLKALSFPVAKEDAYTSDGKKIPGKVVVRTDTRTPLSWCGESYGLVGHSTIIAPLLDALGDDFELKQTIIEREGRRVRVDVMSKEEFAVAKGDNIRLRVSFMNSLDRTSSYRLHCGLWRLLCSNGAGAFMDGYSMNIQEAHTKNLSDTVNGLDFGKALGKALVDFKAASKMLTGMAKQKVADDDAAKLIEKYIGKKGAAEVLGLWTTGRGINGDKSAWNLYNAASQYMTDLEGRALLPVAATMRTYKKTTGLLQGLSKLN